ncbi:MAG: protein-tyrosine-phosphatase [Tardiphaga sp.]|jgi:predicted protein tyrosine phosphatase|nr:protein-tyrosine-phosphatase [Tardiphaga sp.]MDB5630174.1 protein-tyrosine-phosphatase [Tardiphaga sp.]
MKPLSISILTVCGVDEIAAQRGRSVTHVLSLLDPGWPDIASFADFAEHRRSIMHFHDIIDEAPDKIAPTQADVADILKFGAGLAEDAAARSNGHLLVHCQMGISRSTAAMLMLLAQVYPDESEPRLYERLRGIRPQAWPNSRMVGFADDLLGRNGRLLGALGPHYREALKFEPKYHEWMPMLGRGRELDLALAS